MKSMPPSQHSSAATDLFSCELRIVGPCPGHERSVYRSWFPTIGPQDDQACRARSQSWLTMTCGGSASGGATSVQWRLVPRPDPTIPPSPRTCSDAFISSIALLTPALWSTTNVLQPTFDSGLGSTSNASSRDVLQHTKIGQARSRTR